MVKKPVAPEMVPALYVPIVMPVPVSTASVDDVTDATVNAWFIAKFAAFPVCPVTVTTSPTTRSLVLATCVSVVEVALVA